MFVRVVKGSSKKYVLIVRSFRDKEGKPRQETVLNLGPVHDSNEESIVNLAKRMVSHLEGGQIIVDEAQDIREEARHNWGAPAVISNLWERFGLDQVITNNNYQMALKLMMMDRLCDPASKLSTYQDRDRYQSFEGVNLQHMYRSLDYLSDNMDKLKSHISQKQSLRTISDVVFFDATTLYFESQKADLLKDFGYSKDCKFNEVQIVLCLVIDAAGKPLSYEIFPGNTAEGQTLLPVLEKLKAQYKINKLIIVADRGIGSKENLKKIKDAGYDYIIGAKLRSAAKNVQAEAISEDKFINLSTTKDDIKRYKFIKNSEQTWVILHSSKRAQKDRADRERLLEKAQEMLVNKSSLSNKRGARKFIKTSEAASNNATLDTKKIECDTKFDGYYAISFSDNNMSVKDIASAYHGLWGC